MNHQINIDEAIEENPKIDLIKYINQENNIKS